MVKERRLRDWPITTFEKVDDKRNVVASSQNFDEIKDIHLDVEHRIITEEDESPVELEEDEAQEEETALEPEILEEEEAKAPPIVEKVATKFAATKRQIQAKLRFHKFCPTAVMMKLEPDAPVEFVPIPGSNVHIIEYIGQVSQADFLEWCKHPGFWPWFISEDSSDADLYSAKQKATDILMQVLDMDEFDINGNVNPKIMQMKLKAAETILNKTKTVKVENKTVNIKTVYGDVPKALAKMDTNALENRLKQLKGAN